MAPLFSRPRKDSAPSDPPVDAASPEGSALEPVPRYRRYVCSDCAARAASADGRRLAFSNIDLSGGYAARYADTGEPYDSHACWIDGIRCHADEARFGGIVVEVLPTPGGPLSPRSRGVPK